MSEQRDMAILMRYEQVENLRGEGLSLVGKEFDLSWQLCQKAVKRERIIATQGTPPTLRPKNKETA